MFKQHVAVDQNTLEKFEAVASGKLAHVFLVLCIPSDKPTIVSLPKRPLHTRVTRCGRAKCQSKVFPSPRVFKAHAANHTNELAIPGRGCLFWLSSRIATVQIPAALFGLFWLAKTRSSVMGETRLMHLILLIQFAMPSASVRRLERRVLLPPYLLRYYCMVAIPWRERHTHCAPPSLHNMRYTYNHIA